MKANLITTDTSGQIDSLLERSKDGPILLFNFDPYCPISRAAYEEVSQVARDIAIVDVARGRAVTRHISERTGVKHESPQVLLLHGGAAVWSASHFQITGRAIERALAGVADGAAPNATG